VLVDGGVLIAIHRWWWCDLLAVRGGCWWMVVVLVQACRWCWAVLVVCGWCCWVLDVGHLCCHWLLLFVVVRHCASFVGVVVIRHHFVSRGDVAADMLAGLPIGEG